MGWLYLIVLLGSLGAQAEVIEFPEEELASETVLPVFDKVRSVLNRNVQTTGHFEVGGGGGLSLNEPFYNPYHFTGLATYHFTDQHAVNLVGTFYMSGLNSYGEQLKKGEGLRGGQTFDPSKAPTPQWMVLGSYQFTAYYGKLSLSKQNIMNIALFGMVGAGVIQTGGISNPVLNLGLGQNFYFTPRLAARFDLRLLVYSGPDATTVQLDTAGARPSESAFDKALFFSTDLSLGLVYLL
ncbi:MAG: outer membrane beta-barrel domain-containing protein [Bdellovibrionales bacterium]|nr:outer membrane beta-barrel domain-containing protein [Bdellovibrionales bacterium]